MVKGSFVNMNAIKLQGAVQKVWSAQFFAVPLLIVFDCIVVYASLLFAFFLRAYILNSLFPSFFGAKLLASTFELIWWFPLLVLFCLFYENLYQKRLAFWKEVEQVVKAISLAVVSTIVILYLSKTTSEVSRTLVVVIWFILAFTLPLHRYYSKRLLFKAGIWKRPVLILGAGKTACLLVGALKREKTLGYEVVGILNDRGEEQIVRQSESAGQIPILGSLKDIKSVINTTGAQDVFLAMPTLPPGKLIRLANRIQPQVHNVILIPDLFGLSLSGIEAQQFFEEQILMLNIKNRLKPLSNRIVKRVFDLLLGFILLIFFMPLLFSIALLIKVESRGPVFYNARRIGQQGKIFFCHKFRTMSGNADVLLEQYLAGNSEARQEWANYRKLVNSDPRLTRLGHFLRRFSLDELPQLINVVRGDMSLVGPRPYMIEEKKLMGDWYADIVITKPGITGLWQVSGRNLINFEGRMKLGAWYVKNWSIWLDLVLILRTFRVVLKGEGAY